MLIYIHIEVHEYSLIMFFCLYFKQKCIYDWNKLIFQGFCVFHETTGKLMIETNLLGL